MSYRQMTKPLVQKIDGTWGYTCCQGSMWPSAVSLRWAIRHSADNPEWTAAVREAVAHMHVWHGKPKSLWEKR